MHGNLHMYFNKLNSIEDYLSSLHVNDAKKMERLLKSICIDKKLYNLLSETSCAGTWVLGSYKKLPMEVLALLVNIVLCSEESRLLLDAENPKMELTLFSESGAVLNNIKITKTINLLVLQKEIYLQLKNY